MIVHLLAPAQATGDLVGFRSRIGTGNGRWQGPSPQPADVDVDVELDFRGVVNWNTAEISSAPPAIQIAATGTLLRGRVTLWVPETLQRLRDLRVFVDQPAEPVTSGHRGIRVRRHR
jgi:hypothetical protein